MTPTLAHDYTSLSTLNSCAARFNFRYNERLERAGEESAPLKAGQVGHAGLHSLYVDGWDFGRACEAMRVEFGAYVAPLGAKHSHLTLGFMQDVLRRYVDEREARPTAMESGKPLALAEQALVFEWAQAGETLRVGGKPDLPLVLSNGGGLYVVDNKFTTSWISEHWALKFKIGHQLRIYAAMLESRLGERVVGGFINAVYMGPEACDPPEAWRGGKDTNGKRWAGRKSVPSMLIPIDFSPAKLAETWRWVKATQASEHLFQELDIWPQNEQACGDYGGCEYLDLCKQATPAVRKALMSTQYRRWTPTGLLRSGADGRTFGIGDGNAKAR